jgi:L-asparagine transporter-like permease
MLSPIVGPIAAVYVVILTIYSAEKEFERWQDYHTRRHPGEVYVAIWTVLFFSILLATLFFDKSYRMPSEIISTYIAVLGILALTKKSKALYQEKCPSPESHEPAQK